MQGRSRDQRDLFDAESVAGGLLPPGGVFAFLAEHRHVLFPAELFTDLFPSGRGRPSVAPDVVATVMVLQALHGLSDREAAEAVTFDLRWKAACGLAVEAGAFHPSTLTVWRRRLADSKRPERIFEVVREVVAETGVLSGRHRRALDSTVLEDAVATQDTITQLIAMIRRVARDVTGGKDLVAAWCTGYDYSQPGKPRIAWDDPEARDVLVSALVGDAVRLLDHLDVEVLPEDEGEVVALLALVAGQDVEPAEGSDGTDGRWRIARKVAYDRVLSTVDETAGTVTCPNGLTRTISAKRKVTFGAGCAGCPLRVRCTTAARGRKLDLHPHDAVQRAHRARATDPAFQETYRTLRPMVERSIAWLTRGNRKVRYRGVVKNDAWFAIRAAAVNLTRLLTLGLQRTSGTWVLVAT